MLRSATQDPQGSGRLEATIVNNVIAEVGANVAGGIYAQVAGSGSFNPAPPNTIWDSGKMGLNISNNNINVSGAFAADAVVIDNGSSLSGSVYLPGYAGPFDVVTNQITTYLSGKGNVFAAGSGDSGTGGAYYNGGGTLSGAAFVLPVPLLA